MQTKVLKSIQKLFFVECSRISSTAPTRPGTTTDSLTYPAETTTTSATAASQESLSSKYITF